MQKKDLPQIISIQNQEDFLRILQPDTNMVIWRRRPSLVVRSAFAALATGMQGELRRSLTKDTIDWELKSFLERFETSSVQREIICGEISLLLSLILSLSNRRTAELIFGHINSDHCRLFHADHNCLRLVCTFYGKGTEFLLNEHVNRAGLGKGTNDGHIPGTPIQRLDTYDIAIMKGELFPGNAGNGLVHRSPPLLPGDTARLFLAIDGSANPFFRSLPKRVSRSCTTGAEEMQITKQPFPRRKRFWRQRETNEGFFREYVKARYEKSLRALDEQRVNRHAGG